MGLQVFDEFGEKRRKQDRALHPWLSFYGAVHVYNVRLERKSVGDIFDTDAPGEYRLEAAGPERRISVAVRRVEEHSVALRAAGERPHLVARGLERGDILSGRTAVQLDDVESHAAHRRDDFGGGLADENAYKCGLIFNAEAQRRRGVECLMSLLEA